MRKTYIYDPRTKKMVAVSKVRTPRVTPHIMPDISPYQVVGPEYGKVIGSRSTHREYLKRHQLHEAGNDRERYGLPPRD